MAGHIFSFFNGIMYLWCLGLNSGHYSCQASVLPLFSSLTSLFPFNFFLSIFVSESVRPPVRLSACPSVCLSEAYKCEG